MIILPGSVDLSSYILNEVNNRIILIGSIGFLCKSLLKRVRYLYVVNIGFETDSMKVKLSNKGLGIEIPIRYIL